MFQIAIANQSMNHIPKKFYKVRILKIADVQISCAK